uniref:Otoferlin (Trinotate prediction) n=1 Tax=Myxobolus squamalis TaxID=59785 RepID=A0A6B2G8Z2_MYXSQ
MWKQYSVIDAIAWLGLEKNKNQFLSKISNDIPRDTYKELQNDLSQQINFPNSLKLTLRAHVYLAINVKATDSSGSCDPFVAIYFLEHSALTIIKNETLCPVWSQTLFLSDIEYAGMVSKIHDSPPYVIIKLLTV